MSNYDTCEGCDQEIDDPAAAGQIEGARLCTQRQDGWPTWDEAVKAGGITPTDHPGIKIQ